MQNYQSHKIVEAGRITHFTEGPDVRWLVAVEGDEDSIVLAEEVANRIMTMAEEVGNAVTDGYLMRYADGYVSWSPPEAFEQGYDLVQPSSGQSKIAGYRELNEGEVAAMNDVKGVGRMLGDFCEIQRADSLCDQRWVSMGISHLQQGLMCLTRAIAKPEFF